MKKLTLLCLVILAGQTLFAQGFNAITSKDGIVVVAVGNGAAVYRSYDGGNNYGSYPVGSGNHNAVAYIGAKIFITGSSGGVVYSINDGGAWNTVSVSGQPLNGMSFIDGNTGWVVGNGGVIYKTINGGVNWTAQTSGTGVNLNGVKFTDANNGVACGNNGVVIYTANGGTTWSAYTTGTTMDLLSIDKKVSTLITTGRDGFIYKYNGTTWTAISYKITSKSEVTSVHMIDANIFYTCGGGGFINKTTDAGVTRTYQMNPMQGYLKNIYFYNANLGWAVASNNNAILRTIDGGVTWIFQSGVSVTKNYTQRQSASSNIGNPFCQHPKNKNGMFILAGSALYRSLDKGETWTLLNGSVPGSACHSFFVNAVDTNLMIAAKGSGGGRIIGSSNYGTTWYDILNPINLTSYGMPLELDPNNANTVWLAPDNAPIRKSTNWGTNWTILSGGESGGIFRSPCDVIVQFENPNLVIVGDGITGSGSGKVWRSADGGLNWTLINTVSGSEIPMMANTWQDLNLFYHSTWSSGSYWKSTNQGVSFVNLNQSGSLWACDVAKDDPTAVSYDQYGSNSYLSLDAGVTYQTINVNSSPAAGVLFHDKANLLFQHGGGVYKLNISYSYTPVTSTQQISSEIPSSFSISQNYPNPFNPNTKINFAVKNNSNVTIKVYSINGTEVAVVVSRYLNSGTYTTDFNAANLSSGVYFYTLAIDGQQIDTKKMMLIK